ncbi:MAG: alpha/beta fold hydrolase [Candidatus Dormibacterales bacterium]
MRHGIADLDGPVHYLDFGGTGPPLLMVHGLGGAALNWMGIGPEVARTHHAIAVDLAGFGSTPLFDRSAAVGANADLVHAFIEKVVGGPVVLMGNSMGGHIAILEAAIHPAWVRALILVDPAVPGMKVRRPDPVMVGIVAALSIPGLAQNLIEWQAKRAGVERLVHETLALVCADPSRVDPALVEAHVKLTEERAHLGRQSSRAFLQASRSIALRMADPRFWRRVAAVAAPTLVVHGSLDRLIPVGAARDLVARRPDWQIRVLDGVGHVPMMEVPAMLMDAVNEWAPYAGAATHQGVVT